MSEDTSLALVGSVLSLVLVVSALLAHRLRWRTALRDALAWCAIFGLVAVGFAYWPQFKRGFAGFSDGFAGPTVNAPENKVMRIEKSEDGHYWLNAEINGHVQRLMIDTGATTTSVGARAAAKLELVTDPNYLGPAVVETANGLVKAEQRRASQISVDGHQLGDLKILVSESFGDTNVLGMNFLDKLESWRVEQDQLILMFPR